MNSKGEVKIADFGVATTMEAVIGKNDTLVGTPYWMSPVSGNYILIWLLY